MMTSLGRRSRSAAQGRKDSTDYIARPVPKYNLYYLSLEIGKEAPENEHEMSMRCNAENRDAVSLRVTVTVCGLPSLSCSVGRVGHAVDIGQLRVFQVQRTPMVSQPTPRFCIIPHPPNVPDIEPAPPPVCPLWVSSNRDGSNRERI